MSPFLLRARPLFAALAVACAAAAAADDKPGAPPPLTDGAPVFSAPAAPTTVALPTGTRALPPMEFFSSIGGDTIYDVLKTDPAFSRMDKELAGTPIFLVVTHTSRPTAGGSAAGLVSAILAGSTLGLIPLVTSEEFVVRYEIWLQGRAISSYSFTRTKTRAVNMWAAGDKYYGLGKDGLDWLKSTATEFAAKAAKDPELAKLQAEIDYYFPQPAPAGTPPK